MWTGRLEPLRQRPRINHGPRIGYMYCTLQWWYFSKLGAKHLHHLCLAAQFRQRSNKFINFPLGGSLNGNKVGPVTRGFDTCYKRSSNNGHNVVTRPPGVFAHPPVWPVSNENVYFIFCTMRWQPYRPVEPVCIWSKLAPHYWPHFACSSTSFPWATVKSKRCSLGIRDGAHGRSR